jgi:hypothetical protein
VNPSHIVILTEEGHELLERLKDTSLGTLNFTSYAQVVKQHITPLDLVAISKELESQAGRLPKTDVENVAQLRNIAMDLKAAINLVANIKASIVCCLVFVRAFSFIKLLLCKRYFYDLLTFL